MAAVGLRRDCGLGGLGRLAETLEEWRGLITRDSNAQTESHFEAPIPDLTHPYRV
jgi:hypothetical protein